VSLVPANPADIHQAKGAVWCIWCFKHQIHWVHYTSNATGSTFPGICLCLGSMEVMIRGPARHPADTACVGQVGMQPACFCWQQCHRCGFLRLSMHYLSTHCVNFFRWAFLLLFFTAGASGFCIRCCVPSMWYPRAPGLVCYKLSRSRH